MLNSATSSALLRVDWSYKLSIKQQRFIVYVVWSKLNWNYANVAGTTRCIIDECVPRYKMNSVLSSFN